MRSLCLCLFAASALANPTSKMTLVFSEDFESPTIDAAKWNQAPNSPPGTISIKEGKLVLGISKTTDSVWRGGSINTRNRFDQAKGYFEASIKAGQYVGHHLGFVLQPKEKKELYAEIYVVEAFGDDKIVTWAKYNDGIALKDEKPAPPIKPFKGGASHKDFHTYGLLWKDKELTWYIDGKEVYSTKKVAANTPTFLSLGHTVSEFEVPKLDPAKLPDDIQFDWVKVWK